MPNSIPAVTAFFDEIKLVPEGTQAGEGKETAIAGAYTKAGSARGTFADTITIDLNERDEGAAAFQAAAESGEIVTLEVGGWSMTGVVEIHDTPPICTTE